MASEDGQAGHHMGVGQDVIIGIESPELAGLFGDALSSLGQDLLVPGFPVGQLVAGVANLRILEPLSRLQIEFGAVVLDLFGDLEYLKDIENRLHNRSLPQNTLTLFEQDRPACLPLAIPPAVMDALRRHIELHLHATTNPTCA